MSMLEDTPVDPQDLSDEPGANEALPNSLLSRVTQRREARVADETVVLPIPSWDGELLARYKVVPKGELTKMLKKQRVANPGDVSVDIRFLATACVEVIVKDNETDEEQSVSPGFNQGLADALGKPDLDDSIKLLMYLFKDNGIALTAHALAVARWMQDTSKNPDDVPGI